jgi:DNA-binding NarL/FixJ family response regulator
MSLDGSHEEFIPQPEPIRIFLAEDNILFRTQLTRMLEKDDQFKVCGEADNVKDAFFLIMDVRPQLLIVDLSLKGGCGLTLIKEVRLSAPNMISLVLSMHDDSMYGERALKAGAKGYVMKSDCGETLHFAIHQVLAGDLYLSDAMKQRMLRGLPTASLHAHSEEFGCLTARELEVLRLCAQGHTIKEIAHELELDERTVYCHRSRIKAKLELKHSEELYTVAARLNELRSRSELGCGVTAKSLEENPRAHLSRFTTED